MQKISKTDVQRGLAYAATTEAQTLWRRRSASDLTLEEVLPAYLVNPLLRLAPPELEDLLKLKGNPLVDLVAVREAAAALHAPRYAVISMPKSGSSFLLSALETTLALPVASLSFPGPPGQKTYFGGNAQEDELDDLALLQAALQHRRGYVAQHHTRGSLYTALRLRAWGIIPILTVRNIFDCIVSFDDMMIAGKRHELRYPWVGDAPFLLPNGYSDLELHERYELLSTSLGPWLVNFAVSWRRCETVGLAEPVRLHYGPDIGDPERLTAKLRGALNLDAAQSERFLAYARSPDPVRSRFNKGIVGRGRRLIPQSIQDRLESYVRRFGDELSDADVEMLIG